MIGRKITFRKNEYETRGIVFDKIRKRETNNSAVETRYLVKLIKEDSMDFDDEPSNVIIVNPADITNIE